MPSALVAALAAPIRDVAALLGPGGAGSPPVPVLTAARDALTGAAAAGIRTWRHTEVHWSGAAAGRASQFVAAAGAAADALAARAARLAAETDAAAVAVAEAGARVRAIVERFEARAAALEPRLDEPGVAEALIDEARRALSEALSVVDELHTELDRQAAALTEPTVPTASPAPAPITPAGFGALPATSGWGGGLPSTGALGGVGSIPNFAEWAAATSDRPDASVRLADPAVFGDGVAVRLPDGSTVTAPNAVAADAVRNALTQLGVPYQWGGTTPGVGLDCSGLTQWAYQQAGLELPRLAQEQDVGALVDPGALRPGDLAVWDGHVAMIVGGGMMIEAGDPVQLSSIRSTNSGQGFQGFWRPTG